MFQRSANQRFVVPTMFVLTLFLVVMDSSITTVALPSIAGQFHVPTTAIDGVVVVYPVCVGMVIPASGWLGDRFGTKRVLLAAMVGFTAASALCGTAGSLGELVAYRGSPAACSPRWRTPCSSGPSPPRSGSGCPAS
jgi:MFS family permease